MIRLVSGDLGAGKTLYCVTDIYSDLCAGCVVATNIALIFDELASMALRNRGLVLDPAQLVCVDLKTDREWHKRIPWGTEKANVKVYLDELHLFFNARDWQKTGTEHRNLLSFLSQSRKARVDCTFIIQEVTNLERQFRVLAEWEERIVPSSHMPLGVMGSLPIKFFFVCRRDTRSGEVISRTVKLYEKRFFPCYRTCDFLDEEMTALSNDQPRMDPLRLKRASVVSWMKAWLAFFVGPFVRLRRKAET